MKYYLCELNNGKFAIERSIHLTRDYLFYYKKLRDWRWCSWHRVTSDPYFGSFKTKEEALEAFEFMKEKPTKENLEIISREEI